MAAAIIPHSTPAAEYGKEYPMKKIVSLMLALVLTVGCLAGCGTKPQTEPKDTPNSGEPAAPPAEKVTINVALCDSAQIQDLATYFATFTADTGIEVNYELIAEASYAEKMTLGLSTSTQQYDVVMISPNTLGTVLDGGLVQPVEQYLNDSTITDAAWKDGLSDAMLSMVVRDDARWAVPYNMGVSILCYNKAMFRDAGLDPEAPPTTMEGVLQAAEQINDPSAGKFGIAFRANREANANTFLWAMLWMFCGGSWEREDGTIDWSAIGGPESVKATEYFAKFHQYAPTGISGYGFEEAQLAFQQGMAAMWIDTSILAGNVLNEEDSAVAGDVGFAALTDGHAIGSPWLFMMASRTQHPTEAWKFMQYVSGYDVQMSQVKAGVQPSPVRTDVLTDPDIDQYMNPELALAVNYALANDPISNYFPAVGSMSEIRSLLAVSIADVALGSVDAQSATDQLWADVRDVLVRDGVIE